MINFSTAQSLIAQHAMEPISQMVSLEQALGFRLAKDLFAPIDLPPFENSAVDGFAVNTATLTKSDRIKLGSVIRAEGQSMATLAANTATKIMTGAPVPLGADAVVMLEDVVEEDCEIYLKKAPAPRDNIRFCGEDVGRGTLVAAAGSTLSPQLIALLAGCGFAEVPAFTAPSVKVIATGDELAMPGNALLFGQVYHLMGPMLKAQAALCGAKDFSYEIVADRADAISDAVGRAFGADIIVLTGGMSKGDYDFGRRALATKGVQEIFYQGAWRPGKPLYFGKREQSLIFGLPGNPVAAFVCFHVFVRHAIMQARKSKECVLRKATVRHDFTKKPGLTFFARAFVTDNNELNFLDGQGSHQIFSLSRANALCLVPEDKAIVKSGEVVQYYPLA